MSSAPMCVGLQCLTENPMIPDTQGAIANPSALHRRLSHRSLGQFNPQDWLREGDDLFASAKATRATWIVKRARLRRSFAAHGDLKYGRGMWARLERLPKASVMLLAYAVEMYLKAGVAKAYIGCREEMFTRDLRRIFSHNLKKMAREIVFATSAQDDEDLEFLSELMRAGRYPVDAHDTQSYVAKKNARTQGLWRRTQFLRLRLLALRIRSHAALIDRDSQCPASHLSWQVDADGYLAFRAGGRLPPRITYLLSSAQRASGDTTLAHVRALVLSQDLLQVGLSWDAAWIFEDGAKETELRQQPCANKSDQPATSQSNGT